MQGLPAPRLRALHVLALSAFALAQPLFDLLGRHAEFLVAHRADALDVAVLTLALALGIPGFLALATWGLERVAARASGTIHLASVALLSAAIVLPLLKRFADAPGLVLGVASLLVALLATAAYARLRVAQSFVTVLSAGVLAFPLVFLRGSPVSFPWEQQASPSSHHPGIASEVPVVVVVFDGLPLASLLNASGLIDAIRHPHFAALAEGAHWFRNATTVAERSSFAVPAILTGRYPAWQRHPTAKEYPQNLFTLLGGSYDLNVFETVTRLCPEDTCVNIPPRFARLAAIASDLFYIYLHILLPTDWTRSLPVVTATWRDFERSQEDSETIPSQGRGGQDWSDVQWVFSQFLERLRDSSRPSLHYLHLNLPHGPYRYLPSGKRYRPHGYSSRPRKDFTDPADADWAEIQLRQRHLLQVQYADTLLGRLLDRLENERLHDRALIVVVSDHGVGFDGSAPVREIKSRREEAGNILPVPLIVKLPHQHEGDASDRNVETIDILPTIFDVLGAELPEAVDGSSLFDTFAPERPNKFMYTQRVRPSITNKRARRKFGRSIPTLRLAVQRIHALFDLETNRDALFEIGPHRELYGQGIASFPIASRSPFTVHLDKASAFEDVHPDSIFLPAHVTGKIDAEATPVHALELAVSVNGVIRAETRVITDSDGTASFAALVPEASFRTGSNRVEIFVVKEQGDELALVPTQLRPETVYSVVTAFDGNLALVLSSDGRIYPVTEGAVRGHVSGGSGLFAGGAFDVRRNRLAQAIVVFAEGRFLKAHALGVLGSMPAWWETGTPSHRFVPRFRITIPHELLGDLPSNRVRFLALSRDAASELRERGEDRRRETWPGPSDELEIEVREGREGFAASTGVWIPIEAHGGRGQVETAAQSEQELIVYQGWIADVEGEPPPAAALIFVDGRFVDTVPITASPDSDRVVFQARLPAEILERGARGDARFFVPSEGGAAEELELRLEARR